MRLLSTSLSYDDLVQSLHPTTKGPARVRVADVGDEEFPKARLRTVTGGGDKGRGAGGEGDELVHEAFALAAIAGRQVSSIAETYLEMSLLVSSSSPGAPKAV